MVIPMLVFDYELRKDYIIKVYCVNKNIPELHCDGKCYLAEKISQSKEKDESQAMNAFFSQVFMAESLNTNPDFSFLLGIELFFSKSPTVFYYKWHFTDAPTSSLFNPPRDFYLA